MTKIKEEFEVERHRYRGLVIYDITGEQLEQLEREPLALSEDFSFAVVGLTVALSFLTTLLTVAIPSDRVFNAFFILTVIGTLTAIYFGVRWYNGRARFKSVIAKIKEAAGPLGQEGREIGPEELASRPQVQPKNVEGKP